jgi:signal transduction histidine kinase
MGLRGKLALTVAAVTALVAALIGVLVHEQTARTQLESARRVLDARLLDAVEDYEMLMDGGVEVEPPGLPAPRRRAVTAEPVRATYLDRTGAEPVLWAALTERTEAGQTRVLAVRESYRPQAEALAALDRTLLGAGLVAALLGSLLGLVPATIAGRRISGAARTAQRIADGELSARVRPRGRDEIARLATAVNTMAEALGARLEAERRITADIAHELRTPVAGLVTAAELLPPGRPTELVRDRAGTLRRLVEDVLEVARLDTEGAERAEFESCRTSVLARQAVAAYEAQYASGRAGTGPGEGPGHDGLGEGPAEADRAHHALETRSTIGKVMLIP